MSETPKAVNKRGRSSEEETPRPESKQSKIADSTDLITLIATSVKKIKEGQEGMKRMCESKIDTLRNNVLWFKHILFQYFH